MEKKIFKIKYVTNIGLGYWVDRFDGEFGTIGHYNVLILPFCIIRWGTVTKTESKQIIETCGGEEDMIKFSSWILLQDITSRGEGNYVNTDGKIVTVKDLFDQFKKK